MDNKNNDSKRIKIAAVSLCAIAVVLVVFTVMVYKEKRLNSDGANEPFAMSDVSQTVFISNSDNLVVSQVPDSSDEIISSDISSEENVSSVEKESASGDDILNPDFKSNYYMVVYTGSQTIVVYQKDKNNQYTKLYHSMKCSTGNLNSSPTKEGVYSIANKESWVKLGNKEYARYCCLISEKENYYICSVSFSQKKAWTLIDGGYENIGKATTGGNIQLCMRDANWIYNNMPKGTQVNVVNREGPQLNIKDLPKRIKKNGGWDPTDKWSKGNPYYASSTQNATTTTTTAQNDENAVG